MAALALIAGYSKGVGVLAIAQVAFAVRLSQVTTEFEIRRAECDIRTVSPNMIHRITPRFKSLLHECHMIGNLAHPMLFIYLPVLVVNAVLLTGSVIEASFSGNMEGEGCVPSWIFVAVLQPCVTLIIWIWAFGNLNLAIERDIDQDVSERGASFVSQSLPSNPL